MLVFGALLLFTRLAVGDDVTSADRLVLQKIGMEVWENRAKIVEAAEDAFGSILTQELGDALFGDEDTFSCRSCRVFVGGIDALIEGGAGYEELLEFAEEICYNVTDLLGWRGDVICEGIIANYGPPVIYTLNVTDNSTDDVCVFYRKCASSQEATLDYRPVQPARTGQQAKRPPSPAERRAYDKKDMFKIVHLTDVHIDVKYSQGAATDCNLPVCCRDYWEGEGIAGEWGDYRCNLPRKTYEKMLLHIAQHQPDLIINTGDTPSHALWEETLEFQLEQQQLIVDLIREYLPGVPVHHAEGNHDTFPTNMHYSESPDTQELQERLAQLWGSVANFTEEQIETIKLAAYYSQVLIPGLRVLSYNSNYGYTDNFYGLLLPQSQVWLDMLDFMEETFDTARQNGEKVLLLAHHPMSTGYFVYYMDAINDIIDRNGDLIVLQFAGHTHGDGYTMWVDENFNTTSVVTVTGTSGTYSGANPSYKVFYFDSDTMTIVDGDVFYLDIQNATDSGEEPEFQLMYNYQTDYVMSDLSAASYEDFTNRMLYDDDLYYLFRYNSYGRRNSPGECEGECRYSDICSKRSTTDEKFSQCMSMMPFP